MAMAKIPTVEKFLCYFELSTGSLILAWIHAIVWGVIMFIFGVLLLIGADATLESEHSHLGDSQGDSPGLGGSSNLVGSSAPSDSSKLLGITIGFGFCFVYSIFSFGISVAFIKGAYTKSAKLCFPFVIYKGITAVLTLLHGLIGENLSYIILSAIDIYFFIVVYSFYKVLTYGDEQGAYEAHQNASSAGYSQYYQPEDRKEDGFNSMAGNDPPSYQTTEFKAP